MFLRNYFFFRNNYNSSKHTIITGPTTHKHLLQIFFKHVCGIPKLGELVFFYFHMFNPCIFSSLALQKRFAEQLHFSLLVQHPKEKTEYKSKAVQPQTLALKHLHCSFSKNGRVEHTTRNVNYSVCKSCLDN